jgi:hypothetical protein
MQMKNLFILFLVINAIFWGIFPHQKHCAVANTFSTNCPPHYMHLTFGVLSFLLAVYLAQKSYIDSMVKSKL